MRTGLQYLALGGVVLLLAAAPSRDRKIKSDYDKSNDFTRYKRYAIGKNYLLTRQRPDGQAHIDKVLVESLNRQLQAKGFVLDENHPDFRIKYEAGALPEAETSVQPEMLYGLPLDPTFGSIGLDGVPPAVWIYALAKLKLTVTDVGSGKPVWTALASEKIRDPQKALKELNKKVDDLMAKTLKSFPPASKPK
jgi:hypothetical protein